VIVAAVVLVVAEVLSGCCQNMVVEVQAAILPADTPRFAKAEERRADCLEPRLVIVHARTADSHEDQTAVFLVEDLAAEKQFPVELVMAGLV